MVYAFEVDDYSPAEFWTHVDVEIDRGFTYWFYEDQILFLADKPVDYLVGDGVVDYASQRLWDEEDIREFDPGTGDWQRASFSGDIMDQIEGTINVATDQISGKLRRVAGALRLIRDSART